jgi:SAM-dependent methyltransferase
VCQAFEDAKRRGIKNVEFVLGKAIGLPFEAEVFDFTFSERGPLGHADSTLIEALRVLRPGGGIYIETGAWGGPGRTLLTNLEEERERFERLGVRLEILASRVEQHQFRDLYAWFEMQCMIWRYFENEPPFPYTEKTLIEVAEKAGGSDSPVLTDYQTIWVGGQKSGINNHRGDQQL